MGTSRGSSGSRLAVDNTVWASEAEGEEEVLAAFADETALAPTSPTPVVTPARESFAHRSLRLLSPHTPMREVVRTVLIGCLSAMALGASFAIGFGYVWSDLSVVIAPVETPTTVGAPPVRESPPASAATTSATRPTATTPSSAADVRESQAVPQASALAERQASTPAGEAALDPGPAFGVPLQEPALADGPTAEAHVSVERASNEGDVLASQPMLSAESATIAEPVSPASPRLSATPSFTGVAETVESSVPASHHSDLEAVREAIGRYQAAYSQKDVGAMALVWPSVDVAGVARAFENVDRQALTLNDCRVTTSGKLATAVCPGQVRYVGRVGGRQLQERHGTWTIALERNGDAWQFTRLNVR